MNNFKFVYEDNTESAELDVVKNVIAVRISDSCRLSAKYARNDGYNSHAAYAYAFLHEAEPLSLDDIRLVREHLTEINTMLARCNAAFISPNSLFWVAVSANDPDLYEVYSMTEGVCVLSAGKCSNRFTCGVLCKI